ncbi:MAG TPA: PAS domain S-box protein [Steroidobacteraceae bacterium]|nr:PAS domain S-box protein [Steroidobacteraceae bacterium]
MLGSTHFRKLLVSGQGWGFVLAVVIAPLLGYTLADSNAWYSESIDLVLLLSVIVSVYLGGRLAAIIAIAMTTTVLALVNFTAAQPGRWLFNMDRWIVFLLVGSAIVLLLESLRAVNRRATNREQQATAILTAFPDAALVIDDNYDIQLINMAACQLNACSEADAVGKSFSTVFHIVNDKHQSVDISTLEHDIINAPRTLLDRYTLIRSDGKQIPVELRASRLFDRQSHEDGLTSSATVVVTLRDSTRERRTEGMLPGAMHVFRVTADGAVSLPYASPQFEQVTGVNPALCVDDATPFIQCASAEDVAWITEHVREQTQKKEPVHIEFPITNHAKGLIWLAWHGVPSRDVNGGTLWNGLFIDVTQRKLAEQSLKQSEARLLGIVDSSMDGIVTVDEQQGILLFNPAAEHMFRCAESSMIGMSLETFVTNFLRADSVLLLNMLERNEISNLRLGELSNIYGRRVGGEEFPLELAVSRSYVDGNRLLTMTLRDITERKRTAERLQLSQHQLRSALEAGAMGVMRIYSQSRQVEFDDKALELCDLAPPSAQNWHSLGALIEVIHPADRRRISREYLNAVAGRTMFRSECRVLHRDKTIHWLVFRGRVDQNDSGTQAVLTSIVVDITYRKRLDEQRLQSQKLESLGVLAGGIAHDFNNLLLAIAGNAKLALCDLPENTPVASSLQEITKASARATDLVRRILAFSRPHDHKREPVYISVVLDEVLALARAVLPAGIAITQYIHDNSLLVLADASQIHQAIINLLTNAADAVSMRGGEVTVTLDAVEADERLLQQEPELHTGRYARISIMDNGIGMDTLTMERIFDPFFTTKPTGQGTGLGLPIVHGIMKGHDGVITVQSKAGEGTRFDLYFPLLQESLLPLAETATDTSNGVKQGHILYVDDEDALVFLLSRVLQRAGHKVSGFIAPDEALEAFRNQPNDFDLVVSDMSMPGMSGLELARKVLAIRPDVPFIITTGFVRSEDYQAAMDVGVRQLILKPNTVDELSVAIQRVLQDQATSAV